MPDPFCGVLAPVVTPFDAELRPDAGRLARHCRWLLSQDVRLAVFGTNSEANSLSVDERIELLDRLVESGIDPRSMMPGTGCCALPDSVRLTAHAVRIGCGGVLMLPPFYYKDVSDEGLYDSFAQVIDRIGSRDLRIYLYHIPPVSKVPLSLDLIERLVASYPGTVAGIKDSSGEWSNTEAMLEREWDDFAVYAGSESFLLKTLRNGGSGCISATANVNPKAIHELYGNWKDESADERQADLTSLRAVFQKHPMIPAMKQAVAHYSGDAEWDRVRPPLRALDAARKAELLRDLESRAFAMPGLAAA